MAQHATPGGAPVPVGRLRIGYAGAHDGEVLPVVEALSLLPPAYGGQVSLHLWTGEPDELSRYAERLGVGGSVHAERWAAHPDILARSTTLDLLLVVEPAGGGDGEEVADVPAGWSAYERSGRPVWALVRDGSVLSRPGHATVAYRSPAGHLTATAQMMTRILRDRATGRPPWSARDDPQEPGGHR